MYVNSRCMSVGVQVCVECAGARVCACMPACMRAGMHE